MKIVKVMLMQPVCSTKAKFYEDAFTSLDVACDGVAPLAKKLRCKNLLTDLTLAHVALRHQLPKTGTTIVSKELNRLLERLRGRTKLSEAVTLNSFLKLNQDTQDILGSMLALETRDQFDNFTQIDFKRSYDHEALLVATKRARDWVSNDQGRPQMIILNSSSME